MKKHNGDLEVAKDTTVDFTEITGYLVIRPGVKFTAPKLETVGGNVYVNSTATLPKLGTVGGNVSVSSTATLDAPKLETMGGSVYVNSTATLPKLVTVGGSVSVSSTATLDAPKLETVGGNVYVNSTATLPKLVTVGGSVDVSPNGTLPKLETMGGNVYVNSDATLDAPNRAYTGSPIALERAFAKRGLIQLDGILSRLVSKRRANGLTVYKVVIVGKTKVSYVVQRGDRYSHGETVKEAVESLRYKLSDRDTERFKAWKLSTRVSIEDAIQAYRAITGACEQGVRHFCESIKLPKTVTVKRIIELTRGQYGSEQFTEFFNG